MEFPTYTTLKTGTAEPHAPVVALNRPDVANALNTPVCKAR